MILIEAQPLETVDDAITMLQRAISIEYGTLPPYLYALYTIRPGENEVAAKLIKSVAMEEMIHMCLACNILNALGGTPKIDPPSYPGNLPGGLRRDGKPLYVNLDPFSPAAMDLAMEIEEPEDGAIHFPDAMAMVAFTEGETTYKTIGQFYHALDAFLKTLPSSAWSKGHNQIGDTQFMAGNLFPVMNYDDAHRAISEIVSEGEGNTKSPLDFQGEVAHFYKFQEISKNQVLTQARNAEGYAWGAPLGVDWSRTGVYDAISNPRAHDFKPDSAEAKAAQLACDKAYASLVRELQRTFTSEPGRLGNAVRAMFDLRMTANAALLVKLADGKVSGPSFVYKPELVTEDAP